MEGQFSRAVQSRAQSGNIDKTKAPKSKLQMFQVGMKGLAETPEL